MGVETQDQDTFTKRLYVGGLNPSIATKDLQDRFSMFGTVQDVESIGVDGLGQARNFAYLTISSTPQNMKRCLNIMQGSTWRGAKLKIATAKPKYDIKLAAERPQPPSSTATLLPPAIHRKLKLKERRDRKRKRMESDGDGYQCGDMRVVDVGNWQDEGRKRQHWHVASTQPTLSPLLVRPVLIRPTHPIPKPLYPSSKPPPTLTQSAKGTTVSKAGAKHSGSKDADKDVEKPKKVNLKAMKRARTIWIDPSRYGTYKGEGALATMLETSATQGSSTVSSADMDEWEWLTESNDSANEAEPNTRGGRWMNRSDPSKADQHVTSKRRRLEAVLHQIAETSSWPSEIQEIQTLPEKERAEKQERRRVRAEEDVVVSLGDDDIWGDMGGVLATREASPLFAMTEPEPIESADLFADLDKPTGDAGLFDEPATASSDSSDSESVSSTTSSSTSSSSSASSSDAAELSQEEIPVAIESVGLFDSPPASPAVAHPAVSSLEEIPADHLGGPIAADASSTSSDSNSSDNGKTDASVSDEIMSMHEEVYASVAEFAEAERKKGWAVLQQLGFSQEEKLDFVETELAIETGAAVDAAPLVAPEPNVSGKPEPTLAGNEMGTSTRDEHVISTIPAPRTVGEVAQQEDASDKGDGGEKSTPVANGNHNKSNGSASLQTDQSTPEEDGDVDMEGGSAADDDSSSSGDEDEDDEEDSDSSSESDTESESDTDSDSSSDSDSSESEDESDKTNTAAEPAQEKPRQSLKDMFAPKEDSAPGFSLLGNLDLELDSDLEEDVLAPALAGNSQEEVPEPLSFAPMPTAPGATFDGSLPLFFDYQPPAGTQPFAKCETDEDMTAYWNAEKLSMTRDYKKRHREAVKKLKRGFAIAREDA